MPEARKKALLGLAQRYDVAILEDDVYGDLAYTYPRPRTLKSFDDDGRVLLCSSFSKTLAPGLRIGWVAPGRYPAYPQAGGEGLGERAAKQHTTIVVE